MKYIIILILILQNILNIHAQTNDCLYEQIAFDFFSDSILTQETLYNNIKYFRFDGEIDAKHTSAFGNLCMMKLSGEPLFESCNKKILFKKSSRIIKKLNLLTKIFVAKSRIRELFIYSAIYDLKKENIIVVIQVTGETTDDFFSILISVNKKKVIDYCIKKLYS